MQFKLIYKPRTQQLNKKTEVLIECYFERKYKTVNTGVFIEPQFWDVAKSLVITKHPQSVVINNILKTKLRELEQSCYKYEDKGGVFDFNALKNVTHGKDKQTFCDFIAEQLKSEGELEIKSLVKYKYNIEIIKSVIGDVSVDKLTESHIKKLDLYFRETYATSTIARLHIFVQKYIKIAVKLRVLQNNPYDLYKLPKFRPEAKQVSHTMAELDALEALTGLPYNIAMIRDRYLYSCYTGLRISDNLALLKSQLTNSPDGYVVQVHTIKGYGADLIHPLGLLFDGRPNEIAKRWINAHDGLTLFPEISRTYISTVLTVLEEMAGIKIKMTFHVARHTCASLLADISQNPFLIMNILGHSDIKTSMGYIHASPEGTKKQLRILTDWKEKAR